MKKILAAFCVLPFLTAPVHSQETVFDHDFENATSGDLAVDGSIGTPAVGTISAPGGFISDFIDPEEIFNGQGLTYTTTNNGASNEITIDGEGSFNDVGTPAGNVVTVQLSSPAAITGVLEAGQTTNVGFSLISFGVGNPTGFKYVHAIGRSSNGLEVFHTLWRCGSGGNTRTAWAREFGEDNTTFAAGEPPVVDGTKLLEGLPFDFNSINPVATRQGFISFNVTINDTGWNASAINSRGTFVVQEEATGLSIDSGAPDLASIEFFTSHNAIVTGQNKGFWLDSVLVTTDLTVDPQPSVAGDFNNDGVVDCADLDGYVGNIGATVAANPSLAPLDIDNDGTITATDANTHITTLVQTSNGQVGTFPGDLNCDGSVNVLGDAFALVGNLNNSVTRYSQGDINFDGTVNVLGDAFTLIGNLNNTNNP